MEGHIAADISHIHHAVKSNSYTEASLSIAPHFGARKLYSGSEGSFSNRFLGGSQASFSDSCVSSSCCGQSVGACEALASEADLLEALAEMKEVSMCICICVYVCEALASEADLLEALSEMKVYMYVCSTWKNV